MGLVNWLMGPPPSATSSALPATPVRAEAARNGAVITTAAELDDYIRSGANESWSGAQVTPATSMRVAPVFRSVTLIAGAVANMPVDIKRRIDARNVEDANDHPSARLIRRRPNGWMTPSAFRRMLTAHLLLRGKAFALKVVSRGRVIALVPLDPDRMEVKQNDDLSLSFIYQRKNGSRVIFAQNEIFYLIGLTLDGVTGVSVLTYAREAVGLSLQVQRHGASFYKNGATVGLHLKHPQMLGEEGVDNIKASLEEFRGSENAYRTLITEEGMELKQIGMTNADAQYVETMKFSSTQIAMFFGVPPHMLGDTEKSTSWGSGIEQQALGFVAYTLEDWLTTWEETIDRDLLDGDGPEFVRFNRAGLIRGDIKTRFQAYEIGRRGEWLSANDIRAAEGQNPIEGGDSYTSPYTVKAAPQPSDGVDPNVAS